LSPQHPEWLHQTAYFSGGWQSLKQIELCYAGSKLLRRVMAAGDIPKQLEDLFRVTLPTGTVAPEDKWEWTP
jgi:hypothetical protein